MNPWLKSAALPAAIFGPAVAGYGEFINNIKVTELVHRDDGTIVPINAYVEQR